MTDEYNHHVLAKTASDKVLELCKKTYEYIFKSKL